jgi:hypothetical protein
MSLMTKKKNGCTSQMPLTGENYKRRDNKLVYDILNAACIKSDAAWTWIQDHARMSNGRKAQQSIVNHYDGTGELS